MVLSPTYDVAYQPYERPFKVPLQTHHGEWRVRQGIFIALRHQATGTLGVGEISPLPDFGTESFETAIAFCSELPQIVTQTEIEAIPVSLPCTQFGFGTALEDCRTVPTQSQPAQQLVVAPAQLCGLLSTGAKALTDWPGLWQQGYRTLKWKIGVASIDAELSQFQSLMVALPSTARLRLDANGGLNLEQAQQWLEHCDRYQLNPDIATVEYVEQPLPPEQWQFLRSLALEAQTPIALDESVTSISDLRKWQQRHWAGYYILKPAIMGFPWTIRSVCQAIKNPKIFSSVFEASVGRTASLALAQALGSPKFALGFGVDHWLAESSSVSINNSIFS